MGAPGYVTGPAGLVCPMARGPVPLAEALAAETVVRYIRDSRREGWTTSLTCLAIRAVEVPG